MALGDRINGLPLYFRSSVKLSVKESNRAGAILIVYFV